MDPNGYSTRNCFNLSENRKWALHATNNKFEWTPEVKMCMITGKTEQTCDLICQWSPKYCKISQLNPRTHRWACAIFYAVFIKSCSFSYLFVSPHSERSFSFNGLIKKKSKTVSISELPQNNRVLNSLVTWHLGELLDFFSFWQKSTFFVIKRVESYL